MSWQDIAAWIVIAAAATSVGLRLFGSLRPQRTAAKNSCSSGCSSCPSTH